MVKKEKVEFLSEPVHSYGGIVADVMSNSIATSNYTQEETFLREVLQNSCDQRVNVFKPISFTIEMLALTGAKYKYLKEFLTTPDLGDDPLGYADLLTSPSTEVLIVADGNTRGLSGPLDAANEKHSNFAGFFYNVGRQDIDSSSGGSFGLGRTVLTSASKYSTVLVFSRFDENGRVRSRFMGMAISGSFTMKQKRFTGRHWIGRSSSREVGSIAPFEGFEAESIARKLGLDTYLEGATGMVAMVIGNKLSTDTDNLPISTEDRKRAVEILQRAAYKYAWPHMLGTKGKRSVHFKFKYDGIELPNRSPEDIPIIQDYVRCYLGLEKAVPLVKSQPIYFKAAHAREETGTLAWISIPKMQESTPPSNFDTFSESSIALIRQANFVVKYLDVPQLADEIETRGVFKVDASYDSIFRRSEPVAHDDWIPSKLQLKQNARNPVRQTLETIKTTFREISRPKSDIASGSASIILGNKLGRMLGGLGVTGSPPLIPTPLDPSTPRNPKRVIKVLPVGSPSIIDSDTFSYVAEFTFTVLSDPTNPETVQYEFSAHALLDNGSVESAPPEGANSPKIIAIAIDERQIEFVSRVEFTTASTSNAIKVRIQSPQGIAVTCKSRRLINGE